MGSRRADGGRWHFPSSHLNNLEIVVAYDPVVEPSVLKELSGFHQLDVRDPDSYARGHLPHAARVPVEIWEAAAKAGETSFDNVSYWEQAISALGVVNQTPVIIYDDGRMTEAARVWFILQYYGADAAILNGGWPAIEKRDDFLEATLPLIAPSAFDAQPGAGRVGLVDRQTLKAELDSDVRIFDARTKGEYGGNDLRRNARGGHLPGATLLPHADLLNGSFVRPATELHDLLSTAGFQPGDHIVTHCDGGGRAALAAAARAGYNDVRAYYLSFSDWAKDESCTIVR
jgi:thiosulfate/3-mercaptopyruvate sulfurtransferase